MYNRPTDQDLAFGKELGRGRFATTLAVNGYAVKRLRNVAWEDGSVDTTTVEMLRVREGTQRLAQANVPHLSILDEWVQGNSTYYVQPIALTPGVWTEALVEQAVALAIAAFYAGVTDSIPENIGVDAEGNLVIIDAGELCDPEDDECQALFAEALHVLRNVMDD
jgi:hypothetical protein